MNAKYDIFVSYAHADIARVRPIVMALQASGVRVWWDEQEITEFDEITRTIVEGLAESKALLAFYSELYPKRRPCQWELTAAFLAAQHDGNPRRRILVINPERHASHIYPIDLRDARCQTAPEPEDAGALAALANAVGARLSSLTHAFGSVRPLAEPPWHGGRGLGSSSTAENMGPPSAK